MANIKFLISRYQKITPVFKTRRAQAYTMVILSLLTISFFGFFAVRPTLKTIGVLQKQIVDREQVNEKLEQKINALISAQEEYRRIEPDIVTIYSLLPDKPEITSLIIKLEQIGIEQKSPLAAIDISSIVLYGETPVASSPAQPQPSESKPILGISDTNTTSISFLLTYRGLYRDLLNVLDRLTKLNRIVTIKSAEFKLGSTGEGSLVISLSTNTYYYPLNL